MVMDILVWIDKYWVRTNFLCGMHYVSESMAYGVWHGKSYSILSYSHRFSQSNVDSWSPLHTRLYHAKTRSLRKIRVYAAVAGGYIYRLSPAIWTLWMSASGNSFSVECACNCNWIFKYISSKQYVSHKLLLYLKIIEIKILLCSFGFRTTRLTQSFDILTGMCQCSCCSRSKTFIRAVSRQTKSIVVGTDIT